MYLRSGLYISNTNSTLKKKFGIFADKYEYDILHSNKFIKLDDNEREKLVKTDISYIDLYKLNDNVIDYEIELMTEFLGVCWNNIDKLKIDRKYYISWKSSIFEALITNLDHFNEIDSEIRRQYELYSESDTDIDVLKCSKYYYEHICTDYKIKKIKMEMNELMNSLTN